MIRPPRRAITRFLIPFLDVLILLFCIFLLMPFVSTPGTTPDPSADSPEAVAEDLRAQLVTAQLQLAQAEAELAVLRKAATNPGDRLRIKPLEIDANTGKLYAFDADSPEARSELRDQADAQRLIDRFRRLAQGKDIFFLILYPRQKSGYPEAPQVAEYRRWFAGVPYGFDNPFGAVPE